MPGKIHDLTGKEIGSLVAIAPTKRRSNKSAVWQWECKYCGNIIEGSINQITQNKDSLISKYHCKCPESTKGLVNKLTGRQGQDLTGMKIGSLIAISPTNRNFHNNIVWQWECKYCKTVIEGTFNQINNGKDSLLSKYHCKCPESTKGLVNKRSKNIKGKTVGNLIAIEPTEKKYEASGNIIWSWKCMRCGNTLTGTYRQVLRSKKEGLYRCNCDHPRKTM